MKYVIAYDIGTTSVKTCLFAIDSTISLLASESHGYGLYVLDNGGVEQDAEEWWHAICVTTGRLFETQTAVKPEDIAGISFCTQMQGLVLVDAEGNAVRRPMSYMDQRGKEEFRRGMGFGLKIAGGNIVRVLKSLAITGVAALSVKDPVWKYKWVEAHEPDNFKKAYKWFDVKEYFLCRCTGNFVMTEDSAFSTLLYDTRRGREGWSKRMCDMLGVNMAHLPKLIAATELAGTLSCKAAGELGLKQGTPVFGGGGDTPLTAVGAGSFAVGDTHIYCGTSGWVSTVLDKQVTDTSAMIGAALEVERGRYFYFAEMETAGKCLEWVKDHLALDEAGFYLDKREITDDTENAYTSLFDYLMECISKVPAGANGVVFTPWLHGNRCPFEDADAAGMFFNIRLETGKSELLRAVLEGIGFHIRWMIECQERKVKVADTIRFVGGGARSPVACQCMADITGRTIETIASPENAGAVGAAAVIGVGLGVIDSLDSVKNFIPAVHTYTPDPANSKVYARNFEVFKRLYSSNKDNFKLLNAR